MHSVRRSGRASNRDDRFYEEPRSDYRTPGQLDRDRILYSSAFARLAEVTQVVSADKGYVFHNRLTHSLKVAQLARRLAEKLRSSQGDIAREWGGLDEDVAEAAALAHDLGHPPFGHLAEVALDRVSRKRYRLRDGFEGNAQSFRIVTRLAVGDGVQHVAEAAEPVPGLNLSRATLNAIVKYPWRYGENSHKPEKWGVYDTESEIFAWARCGQPFPPFVKSIEAELMDWADDITFSVHDLIDFYCAGRIPVDRLADKHDQRERAVFFDEVFERRKELRPRRSELEDALNGILDFWSIDRRYEGTREQRCQLWMFTSTLITRYVNSIELVPRRSNRRTVAIQKAAEDEICMLKELTWHYVILHNELATDQFGQKQIVETVFANLRNAADTKNGDKLLPPFFREALREQRSAKDRTRIVADYISSLTERELGKIHRVLAGHI